MKYFPMYVNIEDKQVTVIGGGKIATRRIESLIQFGCSIKVVAPKVSDKLHDYAVQGILEIHERAYKESDCEGTYILLAATNDRQVNHSIYQNAKSKGILVNVCDNKDECDFFFPGVVTKEDTVVGITCSGKNHKLAKEVRNKIAEII